MLKKISALLAALAISISMLASCGSTGDTSSSSGSSVTDPTVQSGDPADTESSAENTGYEMPAASLTIDGEEIDTDGLVMLTVAGKDIDFDTFRYYYGYMLGTYYQNYGITIDDIAAVEDGFDIFMEDILYQIKQEYITYMLAEENGIELDDEDMAAVEDQIAAAKSSMSNEEEYLEQLEYSYLTEDVFREMLELSALYQKVEDTLFTNGGKYATSKEDFREIVQDLSEYSRVIHVLIPYECQAAITDEDTLSSYDDMTLSQKLSAKQTAFDALSEEEQEACRQKAKELAEEVLQKAADGEDFAALVEEYGWDPGMEYSPEGYYINQETSFVDEFKAAAFELAVDEVSGLVENELYGWFIIKRLPVDMDYIDENIEDMILEYDTPAINALYEQWTEEIPVEFGEYYDKLTPESIT